MKRSKIKSSQLYLVIGFIAVFLISCNKQRDEHIKNGQSAYKNTFYDLAIQEYEKALKLDSAHVELYYLYGDALFQRFKFKDAVTKYEKAISLDTKEKYLNATICYRLGVMYGILEKYDKAITIYQKSITLDPKQSNAYSDLADIYFYDYKYKTAITYYNRAINIRPTDSLYCSVGTCYRKLGDHFKAIEEYKKGTKLNPSNANIYNGIGLVMYNINNYSQGIFYIKTALRLDPNNDIYNYNLGNGYFDLKKYDEAIPYYEKAIELNPNSDIAYHKLGMVYLVKDESTNRTKADRIKMIRYWVKAAQLGNEEARATLKKIKIDWTKIDIE